MEHLSLRELEGGDVHLAAFVHPPSAGDHPILIVNGQKHGDAHLAVFCDDTLAVAIPILRVSA